VSLPGTAETLRGYSAPKLVLIDEAQHVPDDTYHALRPMLATGGGRLIAAGTAGARLGWFYQEFRAWQSLLASLAHHHRSLLTYPPPS
jgi:hypothetical protein